MPKIFLKENGYEVSDVSLTTPKAVHRLADLQSVSVRPEIALLGAFPAALTALATLYFWRYLYDIERIVLLAVCAMVAIAATSVGTLTVNSLALSHTPDLARNFGSIRRLKRVRAAVVEAMAYKAENET